MMPDFEIYQSPFSWRYGSNSMRQIWSEVNKRKTWRKIWVALAKIQSNFGLVSTGQIIELESHLNDIDFIRSTEIEKEIKHDLMAELKTFAEQCPQASRIIHLGATSMDIEDNADAIRLRDSLELILGELFQVILDLGQLIEKYADTPLMAFTHLQPAEPSTLGYRFATYAQDLVADYRSLLEFLKKDLRGKGFKGAVGSRASYGDLIGIDRLDDFEKQMSAELGLEFFTIATQTYSRRQDYVILTSMAGVGACLSKMALDIRFLQSPAIGELAEPFSENQVGSSAMPFKKNPVQSEKVDSLGRYLAQFPRLAWDNFANSILERTLDDSANRRTMLPEGFLSLEEMLLTVHSILSKININQHAIERNLSIYGPFAATEKIMMSAVKAGADRQVMHELLRKHTMHAWQVLQSGNDNPLLDLLCQDKELQLYLCEAEIRKLLDASQYVGDCPTRARAMAVSIWDLKKQK